MQLADRQLDLLVSRFDPDDTGLVVQADVARYVSTILGGLHDQAAISTINAGDVSLKMSGNLSVVQQPTRIGHGAAKSGGGSGPATAETQEQPQSQRQHEQDGRGRDKDSRIESTTSIRLQHIKEVTIWLRWLKLRHISTHHRSGGGGDGGGGDAGLANVAGMRRRHSPPLLLTWTSCGASCRAMSF